MRLHLAVREALSAVIQTLNEDGGEPAACTVSTGIFVPLGEMQRRGVNPSQALRALAEAGMLAGAKGSRAPTLTRDFGGEQKVGFVLAPRFVEGLDPADFDCSQPVEVSVMLTRKYEMPWRTAYEAYAGLAWLASLGFFLHAGLRATVPWQVPPAGSPWQAR